MFSNLLNYFLKKINKPHLINEINAWFRNFSKSFFNKLEKKIAWFSTIFYKLHLDKFIVFNKKWEFSYIVKRTRYILIFYVFFWIIYLLFIDFNSPF